VVFDGNKKKKQRWRDRHQAFVNQLPYNASEPAIRSFFNRACQEKFTIKRLMIDNPKKKGFKSFAGQAFVTFTSNEDLERALTLDKAFFYKDSEATNDPAVTGEGEGEHDDDHSDNRKTKKSITNTKRKALKYPVNVVRATNPKERKGRKAKNQKLDSGDSENAKGGKNIADENKNLMREADEAKEDVSRVLSGTSRGLGLSLEDVDDGVIIALRRVSSEVARNALKEFDVLGPRGKNKLEAVKKRSAYLTGIIKKWARGEGKLEDTELHQKLNMGRRVRGNGGGRRGGRGGWRGSFGRGHQRGRGGNRGRRRGRGQRGRRGRRGRK